MRKVQKISMLLITAVIILSWLIACDPGKVYVAFYPTGGTSEKPRNISFEDGTVTIKAYNDADTIEYSMYYKGEDPSSATTSTVTGTEVLLDNATLVGGKEEGNVVVIKASAIKGTEKSDIEVAAYKLGEGTPPPPSDVDEPTFDPKSGTELATDGTVTINAGEGVVTIKYTVGSDGTEKTGPPPITVTSAELNAALSTDGKVVVRAVGVNADGDESDSVSATYTIAKVDVPKFNPEGGTDTPAEQPTTVTEIKITQGATGADKIVYKINGGSDQESTDPATIPKADLAADGGATVTIVAHALLGSDSSKEVTMKYTFAEVDVPVFTPAGGELPISATGITINPGASGADKIVYIIGGAETTSNSSSSIDVLIADLKSAAASDGSVTVEAYAEKNSKKSSKASATYTFETVDPPTFDPDTNTELASDGSVTITGATGTSIKYTIGTGSEQTGSSPITIPAADLKTVMGANTSITIKAKAYKDSVESVEASATYTIAASTVVPAPGKPEIDGAPDTTTTAGSVIVKIKPSADPKDTVSKYIVCLYESTATAPAKSEDVDATLKVEVAKSTDPLQGTIQNLTTGKIYKAIVFAVNPDGLETPSDPSGDITVQ